MRKIKKKRNSKETLRDEKCNIQTENFTDCVKNR